MQEKIATVGTTAVALAETSQTHDDGVDTEQAIAAPEEKPNTEYVTGSGQTVEQYNGFFKGKLTDTELVQLAERQLRNEKRAKRNAARHRHQYRPYKNDLNDQIVWLCDCGRSTTD